ncbi:MAG: hypothetical protein KF732_08760 [Flavobacteriales bacterium]|nr:hypothetical protein [Flavobacteriales bacterium]HRN41926.1 hypothetical protein [Vicingus sp.]
MKKIKICTKLLIVFMAISFSGCETWKFITSRGDMSKYVPKEAKNSIFPPSIDVSNDDKVYFAYSTTKGRSICSMDINTGQLYQITEDGNNDGFPVVSNDGEKIIFERGNIIGNSKLFIVNANGSGCKALIDNDMYILDIVLSKNDSVIYFIGGALYSDSTNVLKNYNKCQDVFSVGIDGSNFKRITTNCITSWIYDLKLIDDDHLLVSIGSELDFDRKISNDYKMIKKYYDKNQKGFHRKPYLNSFLGLINIRTGEMEEIKITETSKPYKEPLTRWQKKHKIPVPLLTNSAYNQEKNEFLYGNYDFFKFNYKDKIINYSFTNDSIGIYNYKFLYNQNKLIGVIDNDGDAELILFDIEKNLIDRRLEIDTTKFSPSPNKTIFIND